MHGLKAEPLSSDSLPASALPEVVVQATAEQSVLPTERPLSSVYNSPFNIMDIPRSVTPINKILMDSAGIGSQGWPDPLSITMASPAAQFDASELYEMSSLLLGENLALPSLTALNKMSTMTVFSTPHGTLTW
ncbi:hypothetical protein [Candidatus Methylacidiphilum infernorum]|uniref:Uncharacterized protein n=1 Tax=Methylacidiphilum infernorum (isolate V4) TaxID=481448 RepID=B3DVP5_METI4|nr:hypothetical protein [Candidatus Methylacidiphilum infernorum]ACD83398.1 Hypothetical protein Minf_1344 [Methylacidiphilum infernorum V4]